MFNDIGGSSSATGNTIINYGGGAATSPAAAIRTLAQYNINVSYNTINNNNGSGVNHTTTLRGIYLNTATSANAAITNNTVTVNGGATTSQVSAIENISGSTAASNTISISNNYIANCTYSTATSGNFYCILNSGTPALLTVSSNTVTGNNLSGTGTWYGMEVTSPPLVSITNNVVSNNLRTTSTSGTSYCIKMVSPSTLAASGNTVETSGFSAVGSTGSVYGFYGLSSSVNVNVLNNIIRNLSVAGTGNVYGIREWGVSGNKVIQNNQIYGFTSAAGASMYGINVSVGTITVTGNSIYSLNSSGGVAGSFYGIYISSSTPTTTIFKNKIYDISSGSTNPTLNGIGLNVGVNTLYNNHIGDLRTPAANAANPLNGINVSGGTVSNIFYNTIYLSATSSGALFGSNALYASVSPSVNLRNNILINNSTPNGAGFTTAYRRTGTSLTTYSASSNNNVFYAGTPSANNLIMYDGTNSYQTLSAYQLAVAARDANSFTENTPFLSISGPSPNFLHVNPALPSSSESGAVNITGITDDYDADIRHGNPGYTGSGLAPDIGADEFNQSLPGCTTASGGTQSTTTYTRCAGQNVSISSVGFTTGSGVTYQWQVSPTSGGPYSNVTGGSGANTPAYTSGTLTAGTYYYVLLTTCTITSVSGISNESTVTVNAIPTASATSNSPICSGQSLNLTGGTDIGTNFIWTGPGPNTYTIQNPVTPFATASLSGTYTLVVSAAGCTATPVSISVSITTTPSNLTVTPSSATMCAGGSQTIIASGGDVDKTFAFGTQTNQNTASTSAAGYPAPYTAYYGGQRMQMLVLASELTAAGFVANSPLMNIQFPVVSRGANWGTSITSNQNFQVSVGTTTLTDITSFQSGLTNVVAPMNFTPTVGYNNTHTFSSPFIWDGTSNVIVETTWSNNFAGGTADLITQYNSPTTFTSCIVYRADNITAAATATAATPNFTYMVRPDFKLNGMAPGPYSWSPASSLSSATSATTVATPTASTDYTVTAMNGACTSSAVTSLTISPIPSVTVAATPTAICSGSSASLTASGAATYSWSTGGTSSSINVTPTVTTTYTVDGTNSCGTDTKTINVNVNPTPTVIAVTSASILCAGNSASLTASGASTYSWVSVGAGATVVVSPTTTTTYTVDGVDVNGCMNTTILTQVVSPCTDIQSVLVNSNGVSIYPNPSAGVITLIVTNATKAMYFEVYDAIGKQVTMKEVVTNETQINLSESANGIYSYRLMSINGLVSQGKLIKQ